MLFFSWRRAQDFPVTWGFLQQPWAGKDSCLPSGSSLSLSTKLDSLPSLESFTFKGQNGLSRKSLCLDKRKVPSDWGPPRGQDKQLSNLCGKMGKAGLSITSETKIDRKCSISRKHFCFAYFKDHHFFHYLFKLSISHNASLQNLYQFYSVLKQIFQENLCVLSPY